MLSERALQEGQNHLFWQDNISGLKYELKDVWMSDTIGKGNISSVSSDIVEQKHLLQAMVVRWVFEIKSVAATETPFISSNTTCKISAASCWVLKLKRIPGAENLRLSTHKKLDGSTVKLDLFLTVMLRLIAFTNGDK